jgi:hypothetical protein
LKEGAAVLDRFQLRFERHHWFNQFGTWNCNFLDGILPHLFLKTASFPDIFHLVKSFRDGVEVVVGLWVLKIFDFQSQIFKGGDESVELAGFGGKLVVVWIEEAFIGKGVLENWEIGSLYFIAAVTNLL